MTRRHQSKYRGGRIISASALNQTTREVGRLTGLQTARVQQHGEHFVDSTAGLFAIPSPQIADVVCKLDAALTAAMLADGETATATVWIDNPDWGTGEPPYIATTRVIERVVPWDKATELPADTLCMARSHGVFWKVYVMICEDA